jgi:hypothetical protein
MDWIWIAISSVSRGLHALYYNAMLLVWVSLRTWDFFVISVALLHPHDYSRAGLSTENHTFIDIVVGSTLPVPLSAGGTRKVILENLEGERGQIIWAVFWVLSSAVCTISLVLTYIALGMRTN